MSCKSILPFVCKPVKKAGLNCPKSGLRAAQGWVKIREQISLGGGALGCPVRLGVS